MEPIEPNDSIQPMPAEEDQPVEAASPPTTQVEEQEAPTPAPKKKKLSEDRLAKLRKARERASQVAREKRERKAKPFDEPVVVVEQDESDEDTYEGPPGIIFVRRKRAKKPEPAPANTMSPEMQMLYASMFGSRSF